MRRDGRDAVLSYVNGIGRRNARFPAGRLNLVGGGAADALKNRAEGGAMRQEVSTQRSKHWMAAAALAALMLALTGSWAQQPSAAELRARAVERCKANRGVDCESPQGLEEWLRQEQPMTPQQRQSAAAARLRREQCKAAGSQNGAKKGGC